MKDSIELGYDNNASFGIDPQFGEVAYNSPIDSTKFSAYIISGKNITLGTNEPVKVYTKKQIVKLYPDYWIEANAVGVIIPADSLPVIVSWDKSLFNDVQRDESLITDWRVGGWFDATDGTETFLKKLNETNSVIIQNKLSNYIYSEGIKQYPMIIFSIAFGNFNNIRVEVPKVEDAKNVFIYPTIATDFVTINNQTEIIQKISIISFTGKVLEEIEPNSIKIDFRHYLSGIYFISIQTATAKLNYRILKK